MGCARKKIAVDQLRGSRYRTYVLLAVNRYHFYYTTVCAAGQEFFSKKNAQKIPFNFGKICAFLPIDFLAKICYNRMGCVRKRLAAGENGYFHCTTLLTPCQ